MKADIEELVEYLLVAVVREDSWLSGELSIGTFFY